MSNGTDHNAQLRAFGQRIALDVVSLRTRLLATVRADVTLTVLERESVTARIHNATHGALEDIAQAITAAGLQPTVIEAGES